LKGISEIQLTVRSTEIDVNGHVNNAKYLEYLEWGREDWYEQHGLDYQTLKNMNIVTVVVHVSADYRRESVQNDQLRVRSFLKEVKNTSMVMSQTIDNQREQRIIDAEFVIVTVDPSTHEKIRVPDIFRRHVKNT
jgi:thioesterase-3